ncbi:hypothetical protein QFC24_005028 [Naganishia onofrii]|uniref:Uncharacterized protein n=1 Tax=Naganishia onofrii TaxID=1851511 RepID=A0ACC2XCP8_9TREE|nr:hypothetical protein QFC24_005028 [Naganishia onofrii]
MSASTGRRDSMEALLKDYRDLAPSELQRYERLPSAVEMLRIIHAGRPATFLRGFDPTLQDSETEAREVDWSSPGALCSLMGDRQVSIAITPHGLADALHEDAETGKTYFVQPLTEKMTLKSFFDRLSRQQIISIPLHHFSLTIAYLFAGPANDDSDEICYLQSQNGNIERFDYVNLVDENGDEDEDSPELAVLQSYLKTDVACVTEALGKSNLVICPDPEPTRPIPWISVDPLRLPEDTLLQPITVKLREGETLFLPAGWYHHVMQEEGKNGICVAVN